MTKFVVLDSNGKVIGGSPGLTDLPPRRKALSYSQWQRFPRKEYIPTRIDLQALYDAIHSVEPDVPGCIPGEQALARYKRTAGAHRLSELDVARMLWDMKWRPSRNGKHVIMKHPYIK